MAIKKIKLDGKSVYRVRRMVNNEIFTADFPGTLAGEKKALRFDTDLMNRQKESRAKKLSYLRSRYGYLRGLAITYNRQSDKFVTVFTYTLRGPDGNWHHRALDTRCGRTFKGCFDIMVEDIVKILKPSKTYLQSEAYKKLIADTYKFMRAKDNSSKTMLCPKPVKKSRAKRVAKR